MGRTMAEVDRLPASGCHGWADQACRVADCAMSWRRDAAEGPAAALAVAAAHSARWMSTTQLDPTATAALADGSRLSQAAAESLSFLRLAQCEAEKVGLVGEAWSTAGAGEGGVVAVGSRSCGWALRAAQANASAQRLTRAAHTDPLHLEGAVANAVRQIQQPLPAVAADALTTLSRAPWPRAQPLDPHPTSLPLTFFPSFSPTTTQPLLRSCPARHRLFRRHRSTPMLHKLPLMPSSITSDETLRTQEQQPLQQTSFTGKIRKFFIGVFKIRAMAVAAATFLALLLLLAASPGVCPIASWGHSQLALDIGAFQELLLVPKVQSLLLRLLRGDPDLNNALHYMGTARFRKRCLILEAMPELENLSQALAADGVGLRTTLRRFSEQLELVYSRVKARKRKKKSKNEEGEEETPRGSLRPVLQELKSAIPAKQIQGLFHAKIQDSEPFQRFVKYITGGEMMAIVKKIKTFKEYTTVVDTLKSRDIEIDDLIEYFYWLFTGNKLS